MLCHIVNVQILITMGIWIPDYIWILGLVEVLGWKSNEWVANPLGPGQTSALQIKIRLVWCSVATLPFIQFSPLVDIWVYSSDHACYK